ncbi:MAG TPA: DUF4912 domain-containing protein [Verrucomicrobiae bacterium]|jgi:hypothetical protein|nr:DUF4912 domain-containing protein [Verrucomicrobiae bacterium]
MKSNDPGKPPKPNGKTAKPKGSAAARAKDKISKVVKSIISAKTKPAPEKTPAPAAKPAPAKKPSAPAVAAKAPAPAPRAAKLKAPAILSEGDATPAAPVSGPGKRFATGPTPPVAAPAPAAELPESYGTKQLFLTARDPRWLFAHWDFRLEQVRELNALSADGHLALRVFAHDFSGKPLDEIQVHPESRNWFVPVPRGAERYVAELGYRDRARQWVSVVHSSATLTPPDSLSDETGVRFATIPYEVPFVQLLSNVKAAIREHTPLVEAVEQLRAAGHPQLPAGPQLAGTWTPAQEKALAEVISLDQSHRIWIGSLEITELIRRRLQQELSSMGAAQFGLPSSWAAGVSSQMGSVTSPFGGGQRRRGFWFNVNAELIIYGATEPDATVTIGDRKIKLRPDGSFSFRFALPDGDYNLPAAAHSADGEETRRADLRFHRGTKYEGDVGAHPQDKNLRPPVVAAVA